jgi:hypothetical protein
MEDIEMAPQDAVGEFEENVKDLDRILRSQAKLEEMAESARQNQATARLHRALRHSNSCFSLLIFARGHQEEGRSAG